MSANKPEPSEACSACGGELFRFEPPPSIEKIDRSALPTACRRWGRICVGGTVLTFPSAFQKQAGAIADEAARQGQRARSELLADPNARIEKYFDSVYRKGFVDGLSRAIAYFTHHAKEGRLKRLRRLWADANKTQSAAAAEVHMPLSAFFEFDDLLTMSAVRREDHAQSSSNLGRTG
jgi:hypothetical protein